jgi:tetratricopeptide (TPR) repeat protein
MGDRQQWGVNWSLLAQVAYYEGDFVRALEMAEELYTEAHHNGDMLQQAWALGAQGQSMLRLGRLEEANALLDQSTGGLRDVDERLSQISNAGLQAMALLRQQNYAAAHRTARAATDLLETIPVPSAYFLLEGFAGIAETYLALWETSAGAEPDQRRLLAQRGWQACDALSQFAALFPIGQPRALLWRGLAFWLAGNPTRAHHTWQDGLARAESLAMPYEHALAHYERGRHLTGKLRRQHLDQAAALFTRLNATDDLRRIERL